MPEPRPRTPTQIEASHRNGARSHGPVTTEGKARASRNAFKHGLCAMRHLVREDELPDDLEALIAHLTAEVGAAPKIRPPEHGYQWEQADPLNTFDVRRFNAIRGHQPRSTGSSETASRSCAGCARTRWRARTNPTSGHGRSKITALWSKRTSR